MRTTVNIDDHLLQEAKILAVRERRSLGDIIDDALRIAYGPNRTQDRPNVPLPVSSGRLLVDLDDKEALAEILGDNEWPRADS